MIKKTDEETNLDAIVITEDLTLDTLDDPTNKPIPIAKLIKWRQQGLSYAEIGNLVGTSKQAVHQRLALYRDAVENLPAFKDHRADIFAVHQSRLLDSLTEGEIKKIPPGSKITGAAILYDKERLERGKSTANISYADMTKQLAELDQEIKALEAELYPAQDKPNGGGGPKTDK